MDQAIKNECFVCKSETECSNRTQSIKHQQECKRFQKLVCRYLNFDTELFTDSSSSLNITLSISEKDCFDNSIACCETCVTIIKSFSDTYNKWKILQLGLNWKLETIKNLMLVKSKTEDVKPSIKELEQHEFRNKFLTIVNRKSREFPRLIIPKVKLPPTLTSRSNLITQSTAEPSLKREPTDISDFENDNDDFVNCDDAREDYYQEQEPDEIIRTRQNKKVKQDKKLFKCSFCNMRLSTRFNQRRHEIVHHSDRVSLTKHKGYKYIGVKPFQCSICQKEFRDRFDLKKHETIHSKPKITLNYKYSESEKQKLKHKCKFCGKRFRVKWNWLTHERIHTGEKPFSCRHCGKKFNYMTLQKKHELTHKRNERDIVVKQEQEFDAEHKSGGNASENNAESTGTGDFEEIRVRIVSNLNVPSESPDED